MAADRDLQEDGAGGGSDSSASDSSLPPYCPSPSPLPLASCPLEAASTPSPLYHQRRPLSLHLSPAATPVLSAQARPLQIASSEPFAASGADRLSRDDCWSENATFALIHAWSERHIELNLGNVKRKQWKDVADCVNSRSFCSSKPAKTDVQCKNRLDTLKKKYKIEKSKLVTGAPSKWTFFDRLDEVIGSSKKTKDLSLGKGSRSAAGLPDGDDLNYSDDQCIPMPVARCTAEDDMKPPLFFFPPQATMTLPPPSLSHPAGGVLLGMSHPINALQLNRHASAAIAHCLAAEGAPKSQLADIGAHHVLGNVGPAVNHRSDDAGGSIAAAADIASKSKADPNSQSSLPHKSPLNRRRIKNRRGSHGRREDGPYRELAMAVCKLCDVYERVEIAKLEQTTALEKRRRELVKDLEIQRMQTFAKLQIEVAKIKYGSNMHSKAEDK